MIRDLYRRADALVGKTRAALDDRDVLLVMSDHGFKPFRRAVNLNAWFREEGYLYLQGDPAGGPPPPEQVPARLVDVAAAWQTIGDETVVINEGCLSVPLRGMVTRHVDVRVRYLDRHGVAHDEVKRGLPAGTWQH